MKRFWFFLREFKIDILTTVIAVLGIIATWKYAPTEKAKTIISISVSFIVLFIIIYSRTKDKNFIFSPLTWRIDNEKWIGHGVFKYVRVQKAFEVTDADPGYIHSDLLTWSDYSFKFDFKIVSSCIGVLVRAVNLANYIMLQIRSDGIRPHLRINGGWKAWEPSQANLDFVQQLNNDSWHECVIKCDKDTITIQIFCLDEEIFNRSWIIPRGMVEFEFNRNGQQPSQFPFPISLEYGSVGFRNCGTERAFVRNVYVKKL